jgi:hypothetical protein
MSGSNVWKTFLLSQCLHLINHWWCGGGDNGNGGGGDGGGSSRMLIGTSALMVCIPVLDYYLSHRELLL